MLNGIFAQGAFQARMDRQREREESAINIGQEKFHSRLNKALKADRGGEVGAGKRLLQQGLPRMTEYLTEWVDSFDGKRGRQHVALKWIKAVGPDTAAYLALKATLDSLHKRPTIYSKSLVICGLITDELRYRRFRELAPGLFEYKMDSFQTGSYAHMARSLRASMKGALCAACRAEGITSCDHLDTADLEIPGGHALKVGTFLIDTALACTGLAEVQSETKTTSKGKGKKLTHHTELRIVPTAETLEWMSKRNDWMADLFPPDLPMVVPPLRWAPGQRGGYHFAMRGRHAFVRGVSRKHEATIQAASMPLVYDAVNRIQETAWRINGRVLEVLKGVVERGGDRANIPSFVPVALPARPMKEWASDDERKADPEFKAWKKEVGKAKNREYGRGLRAAGFSRVLDAALEVAPEDAIWFPYNVDFRGRIYPVTDTLSPQGDDIQKGLLLFAQGKPLGDGGAQWLAVHGANTMGNTLDGRKVSRMTVEERVEYIRELTPVIVELADDPFGNPWWMEVDEPWQFLAFAFEWAGFARAYLRGEDYVCALPVAQDGSCNGLQHYAAAWRDARGAAEVNVSPSACPRDVYQSVTDEVLCGLEAVRHECDMAELWLTSGLVVRSLLKRPVMTFAYGSKTFGFRAQILEYLDKEGKLSVFDVVGEDGKTVNIAGDACSLLAKLITGALQGVVTKAVDGMAWMQKSARQIAKQGNVVEWTVPATGFHVRQEYFVSEKKQVKTMIAGKCYWPVHYEETAEVLLHKQSNAVAPNVIHSMDAAALMLTVTRAADAGIEHFAMVHDSYGTLPTDAAVLADLTRRQFARLYSEHDLPAELHRQWQEQAGDEILDTPPSRGTLDVGMVITSKYFFC